MSTSLLEKTRIWAFKETMSFEVSFPTTIFNPQNSDNTGGGNSPWGTYTYAGQLDKEWGIDGTVAVIKGRRYYYWSCQRNNLQSLCGAELTSPNKLGPTRFISSPTLPFERHGKFPVNEGPEHLSHGGRDYLVYSASYCWTQYYSLGLLTLRDGGNPLDSKAWVKSGPIMQSANGNFGPGHNG
jgi:GH43 family beta-xylosidase